MERIRAALALIMIWLDTLRGGPFMVQATFGRFYVRYPDGKRSQQFYYRTARQYAEMYGGRIVHQATGHELRKQYAAPNFTDAPPVEQSDDLPPTHAESQLMACLKVSLGDAVNLDEVEQRIFVRIMRQARDMVEREGLHEMIAKSFVARSLKETESPSLRLLGERYLSIFE